MTPKPSETPRPDPGSERERPRPNRTPPIDDDDVLTTELVGDELDEEDES